jgi:hypothetical protein
MKNNKTKEEHTTIFLQNKSPEEIILKENGYTIKRPEKWK